VKEIEELYAQYSKDIYGYLLSLTKDPLTAEDLLSETFVKAIVSIGSFRGESSIKTWLFTIARNNWLQLLRKEKRKLDYQDLLLNYVSESTEISVINQLDVEKIHLLLEKKDERTRTILSMRIEGYSFAEIAERLNISESTARVIDYRPKKWLRKEMEGERSC